jgi:peptidoglycan/LPS O-acetylase OafA/YrhL
MFEISHVILMQIQQRNVLILLILALAIVLGVIRLTGNTIGPDLLIWFLILGVIILVFSLLKTSISRKNRIIIALSGLLLILATLAVQITGELPGDPVSISAIFTCGFILLVWAWKLGRQDGRDRMIQDERSLKIGTYGISYSWYLTFLVVAMLGWLAAMGKISLDIPAFSFLLIILMPISACLFQWYFNRVGDVF